MLALLAQGTRIILKRTGFRFTARRLLPWILWASSVLVVVSVTAFIALGGLAGDARLRVVSVETGDRTPEAGPEYSLAPKTPYEPSEEPGEDAYAAVPAGRSEARGGAGTNPSSRGDASPGGDPGDARPSAGAAGEPGHRAYLFAYPDGYFGPNDGISRADTAIMFARLFEEPWESETGASGFDDVVSGSPYAEALIRMEEIGVVTGCPGGSFRPEAHISRAEFVSICLRLAKRRELSESRPAPGSEGDAGERNRAEDANERVLRYVRAGHWARAAIEDAAEMGWLDACAHGGSAFLPDGYITRAEVATIVNRMTGRSADISYIRSRNVPGFRDVPTVFWAYPDIIEASVNHDFEMSDGKEIWLSIR
jgi:hypothetical protein